MNITETANIGACGTFFLGQHVGLTSARHASSCNYKINLHQDHKKNSKVVTLELEMNIDNFFFILNKHFISIDPVSAKAHVQKIGTCTKGHQHDIESIIFTIYICVCQKRNPLIHLPTTILSCASIPSKALCFFPSQ